MEEASVEVNAVVVLPSEQVSQWKNRNGKEMEVWEFKVAYTYNFAKTPFIAAHAPDATARTIHNGWLRIQDTILPV